MIFSFSVALSFSLASLVSAMLFKSKREPLREKERDGDSISEIRNSSFEELYLYVSLKEMFFRLKDDK